MPLRDVTLTVFVFGALPFLIARPYLGLLMWVWLSYMNPHRLTWGFAEGLPMASAVALVTMVGWFFNAREKRIPLSLPVVLMLLLIFWICFTTVFAELPSIARTELIEAVKMFLLVFLTISLVRTRDQLNALIWVIVMSLAFYGIKGGIFGILTGGQYIVWGPPHSFIAGNNGLALALVMILPLIWYLYTVTGRRLVKWGLAAAFGLCSLSVLICYSRGSFIAIAGMSIFLALRSRHKVFAIFAMLALAGATLALLPDRWFDRLYSIEEYGQDPSVLARLEIWKYAWQVALDRPIVGGGFGIFDAFYLYPEYNLDMTLFPHTRNVHSIYFEVLGGHGFVGLLLFVGLGLATFAYAGVTSWRARRHPNLQWAGDLARMIQVSLVGYGIGGAFVNKAFTFVLCYHLVAILVIAHHFVRREMREQRLASRQMEPAYAGAVSPQ